METISAWVYNPERSLFGDKGGHAAAFKIVCQNPQGCDLYTKSNTCILTGGMSNCEFGRKTSVQGPTRRARNFHSWMADQKKQNSEWTDRLESNKAWHRIVKIQDHYYLPYSFMSSEMFSGGSPLPGKWVSAEAMTPDLLERICTARPMAMIGGEIADYQRKEVPKFLADLRMFYPDLFDLLSEKQKARAVGISSVGRLADITTCLPGSYVFSDNRWAWDGERLTGRSMLFQPVKGRLEIAIVPDRGQGVKITDDAQVGPHTVFLD